MEASESSCPARHSRGQHPCQSPPAGDLSMSDVNLIVGQDGGDILNGCEGPDLIYGFDPNGPQSLVSSITATRVAAG